MRTACWRALRHLRDRRALAVAHAGRGWTEEASYQLLVEANDQGRNPGSASATATVHIVVEDENDNYPSSAVAYVGPGAGGRRSTRRCCERRPRTANTRARTLPSTTSIGQREPGRGSSTYTAQRQPGRSTRWTLRPSESTLCASRPRMGGRPRSSTPRLVSQVLDVNDNAPIFVSSPFRAAVLENVPLGHSVLHIQADADAGGERTPALPPGGHRRGLRGGGGSGPAAPGSGRGLSFPDPQQSAGSPCARSWTARRSSTTSGWRRWTTARRP